MGKKPNGWLWMPIVLPILIFCGGVLLVVFSCYSLAAYCGWIDEEDEHSSGGRLGDYGAPPMPTDQWGRRRD